MQKIILTGVSCSGKSTLLAWFKQKGYYTLPEVAEYLIRQEDEKGGNIFPWTDYKTFNDRIIALQRTWERAIPPDIDLVIMDRSLVDVIAYLQDRKLPIAKQVFSQTKQAQYTKAFFLEMLPKTYWDKTHSGKPREQTYARAKQLRGILRKTYKSFNIPLIDISVQPVEKRANMIVEHLKN